MIKDKKGLENLVAGHLSRLINEDMTREELEIHDEFFDESLLVVNKRLWFADFANYKVAGIIPKDLNWHQRKNSFMMHALMFGMILICLRLEQTTY